MTPPLLIVDHLRVRADGHEILRGIDLEVRAGEVHAIMGVNGSGKSTLARVLSGQEGFEVEGSVRYLGEDLLAMPPEARAQAGLFMAFQYPVEIPGVSNLYFLKAALNAVRRHQGLAELDAMEFLELAESRMRLVGLDRALVDRPVNQGFSGGEKKRNEVFQLAMLEPRLAILDETDSGLDVDALRVVAGAIRALQTPERAFVLITHYRHLLQHVAPDRVHVMAAGRIVREGGGELAEEIDRRGFAWMGAS